MNDTWIRDTGNKIAKFQQFKVMSWRLQEETDDGLTNLPIGGIGLLEYRGRDYLRGKLRICEMPGQPIKTINATVGSELCMLHGPETSIMLKNFYVKSIQTEPSYNARVEYGDPFSWNHGHIDIDQSKMLDDLRSTIWQMEFRYFGVELVKESVRLQYMEMINSNGWGKDNEDHTLTLPPSNDKLKNLPESNGNIHKTIIKHEDA